MSDNRTRAEMVASIAKLHAEHFGTEEEHRLGKLLAAESARQRSEMAYDLANRHMPEDIRSRARAWGMEAFCEVLWNNAFQCGWREANRRTPSPAQEGKP